MQQPPAEAVPAPICYSCRHYYGEGECAAFPEGIPTGILLSEVDHRKPVPGDNGIQYEPEE